MAEFLVASIGRSQSASRAAFGASPGTSTFERHVEADRTSSGAIAADLNARGIAAPNGGRWFPMQVSRARPRLGITVPAGGLFFGREHCSPIAAGGFGPKQTSIQQTVRILRGPGLRHHKLRRGGAAANAAPPAFITGWRAPHPGKRCCSDHRRRSPKSGCHCPLCRARRRTSPQTAQSRAAVQRIRDKTYHSCR